MLGPFIFTFNFTLESEEFEIFGKVALTAAAAAAAAAADLY